MSETAADAPPSPVRVLRETFGDPKPPAISRKITACVACRKQKIKCHMRESQPPCTRCKKRGLPCTVNRSLQMLLESDTVWKHSMEKKIKKLEAIVGRLSSNVLSPDDMQQLQSEEETGELPPEDRRSASTESPINESEDVEHVDASSRVETQPNNHWDIVMDLDSGPGAIPGFYISQSPNTTTPSGRRTRHDIISRGIISLEDAQRYFSTYQNRLDHFPYRILGDHSTSTLENIRSASPLLVAAVCTVGALHIASPNFDACYGAFVSQSASQTFSKNCTVDDVRALCIGAFWLSELSWTLVGAAVRIATELQLHKSYFKAMQGDRQAYLRARLYYLVYACDHHFSVAFGRPPMTRQCEAIKNVRKFLECEHATEDDARLASQVLRWSICSDVFDTFGVNVDSPLLDAEVPALRRFSIALDSLRAEWADKFSPNAHVGNYPRKGVGLQYHFAKLYLCSHAFRGAGSGQIEARSQDVALELDEIANAAVMSALSILRTVVSDTEIQSYLDGLPIYFDIMIAFAAVFLLKVSTKFSASVHLDLREIRRLMSSAAATLKQVTSKMHQRHLLVSITRGIESLLQRTSLTEETAATIAMALPEPAADQVSVGPDTMDGNFSWGAGEAFDPYFMGTYDLLLGQDMNFISDFPFDHRNPHQ